MRSLLPGLALALVVGLLAASFAAPPQSRIGSTVLHSSAVNLTLNYSDPASDVFQMWTSNNSHVTDAAGFWIMSPSPGEVNLLRLGSTVSGTDITLYLRVQSKIASRANTTYEIRMYSRADNRTHYLVDYSNGSAFLKQNVTGSPSVDVSANVTTSPPSALEIVIGEDLLGGAANITSWNIDATSKEVAGNYTYEDFVWQEPGNPGSSPAFIQGRVTDAANGAGLAGVNVSVSGLGFYTTTNATGYYNLPAAPGNFTMSFSLSGYDTATEAVSVQYQQTQTVNAQLSRASPFAGSLTWILVGVVIVAAAVIALFLIRRRMRGPSEPKTQEPPESGKP